MKVKKPTKRSKLRFDYFSQCPDVLRLPAIPHVTNGYPASVVFHHKETFGGALLPCSEPVLLSRALNGKEQHGLTVTHIAEDYLDRLIFASELKSRYPEWVQKDILGRAATIAQERYGYIPTFVSTGEDFSTLPEDTPFRSLYK